MPFFDLPGADLFYQARGDGPPALFIHGFALDHTIWLRQLDALAPLRRCVAVDLRGHGRSGIGIDPAGAASHHLDDLLSIVELLGGEADLVGHSMGAHLARSLAVERPHAIRSLVLIGVMRPDDYTFGGSRPPDLLRGPKHDLVARFADGMLCPDSQLLARARAQAMIEAVDWNILFPGPSSSPARQEQLPEQPVLLATGESDRITPPENVLRYAADFADARTTLFESSAHLAPVENSDAVSEALASFWLSLPRTRPTHPNSPAGSR